MSTQPVSPIVRNLGDTAGQYAVSTLDEHQSALLSQYALNTLDGKAVIADSQYMISDQITGEQYLLGAAVSYNDDMLAGHSLDGAVNIEPIAVELKNSALINTETHNKAAVFKKLGINDTIMPALSSVTAKTEDALGRSVDATQRAADMISPRALATLISQEQNHAKANQKALDTSAPDFRDRLRGHLALDSALKSEAESIAENEQTNRAVSSWLYQNTFEPEGYSLDKENNLISPDATKRNQNAEYSALGAGMVMNLNDVTGEYLVGKPSVSQMAYLTERVEQNAPTEADTLINAIAIQNKAEDKATLIYAVTDTANNSGRFKAVRLDSTGMVMAEDENAMAMVGIDSSKLNQGSKWSHNEEGLGVNDPTKRAQFFNQVSPFELMKTLNKKALWEQKVALGTEPSINSFNKNLVEIKPLDASDQVRYHKSGIRGMAVAQDSATAIAKATMSERYTITSIETKEQMAHLGVILGTGEPGAAGKNIIGRELVAAIKLEDHHSDNSSDPAEPGKLNKVRIIAQERQEYAGLGPTHQSKLALMVHEFSEGKLINSYDPRHDTELSLNLEKAIEDTAKPMQYNNHKTQDLLTQDAVVRAILDSPNNAYRNDPSNVRFKNEDDSLSPHPVMRHINQIEQAAKGVDLSNSYTQSNDDVAAPRRHKM